MRFIALLAVAAGLAFSAVESDAVARASALRWKLVVNPDTASHRNAAGRISVKSAKGREQVYWYCVYSVKSTHDEAIPLSLNVTIESDASDQKFNEGYYPRAIAEIKKRFGDDVVDNLTLNGTTLEPGQEVRAAAVFQIFQPGDAKVFEERVNTLTIKFDGYADPVKRTNQEFTIENIQLWMTFDKKGDQFSPGREPVIFKGQEEKIVSG